MTFRAQVQNPWFRGFYAVDAGSALFLSGYATANGRWQIAALLGAVAVFCVRKIR